MKKKLALLVTILVVVFSCKKIVEDQEARGISTFDVKAAKEYYGQLLSDNTMTTSSDKKGLTMSERKRQEVIWSKAYSDKKNGIEYIEVPVSPSRKEISLYNFAGDHIELKPDKSIVDRSVQKMVFYRDATGKVTQRIVTYIPDRKYLVRRKNEVVLNSLRKLQSDFFGYIEYREWEGNIVAVLRVENGKVTKRYIPNEAKAQKSGSGDGGMNTLATICNTTCVDNYSTYCVSVPEGEGYSVPYCTSEYVGTTCTTFCYDEGNPPTDPCPSGNCNPNPGYSHPTNLLTSNEIATSIPQIHTPVPVQKFIDCFSDGKTAQSYSMTLYYDQPIAGTSDVFRFTAPHPYVITSTPYGAPTGIGWTTTGGKTFDVGHTFIAYEKINTDGTKVTQVIGFYPGGNAINSPGIMVNDGGHEYDVSYKINVSASQFNTALSKILAENTAGKPYNLSTYNCTDSAQEAMNAAGANLPYTSTWQVVINNPGHSGQVIGALPGASKTTGHAPSSKGPCN